MNLRLAMPDENTFRQIKNYIHEFELDDRGLKREEFVAAFRADELVGFGRLRQHSDCTELCSLGVVALYRRQGIGKAIVAELIRKAPPTLHLVCIIPNFFTPFGFRIVTEYPLSIESKIRYCTQELVVTETYVAMVLHK